MADDKKANPKQADAPELVTLRHPDSEDGILSIGDADYMVEDGEVSVAPAHVAHAHIAGFRAA